MRRRSKKYLTLHFNIFQNLVQDSNGPNHLRQNSSSEQWSSCFVIFEVLVEDQAYRERPPNLQHILLEIFLHNLYHYFLYMKYMFFTQYLVSSLKYPGGLVGTLVKRETTWTSQIGLQAEFLPSTFNRRSRLRFSYKISLLQHVVGVVSPGIPPDVVIVILLSWQLVSVDFLTFEFYVSLKNFGNLYVLDF